jgi:uncharacterized membrane protein YphA (DoxX/SURF4 family)
VTDDHLLMIARLCLAAVFLYSGITKSIDWNGTVAEMRFFKLPMPPLAAALCVVWQIAGGLSVLTGIRFEWGALSLAAFTIVATAIGHGFWRYEGAEFRRHLNVSLEHLAIVGGFVALAAAGPGRYSLL